MMSRAEHLAWCKQRALDYVNRGELVNALASFTSDMDKHPDTAETMHSEAISMLAAVEAVPAVMANDAARLRRFIEGFN